MEIKPSVVTNIPIKIPTANHQTDGDETKLGHISNSSAMEGEMTSLGNSLNIPNSNPTNQVESAVSMNDIDQALVAVTQEQTAIIKPSLNMNIV